MRVQVNRREESDPWGTRDFGRTRIRMAPTHSLQKKGVSTPFQTGERESSLFVRTNRWRYKPATLECLGKEGGLFQSTLRADLLTQLLYSTIRCNYDTLTIYAERKRPSLLTPQQSSTAVHRQCEKPENAPTTGPNVYSDLHAGIPFLI